MPLKRASVNTIANELTVTEANSDTWQAQVVYQRRWGGADHFAYRLRRLIDAGRFEIAWLVPTWPKQRRLQIALAPLAGSSVRIVVHTIPELLELAAPIGSSTTRPLAAASH